MESKPTSLSIIKAWARLPCALNAEGVERGGFAFIQRVLQDAIHAAATGAAAKASTQIVEIFGWARCDHFHLAFFRVADPAAQADLRLRRPVQSCRRVRASRDQVTAAAGPARMPRRTTNPTDRAVSCASAPVRPRTRRATAAKGRRQRKPERCCRRSR